MEISTLGSKNTFSIVECLLYSQLPSVIIRNTGDKFLLPYQGLNGVDSLAEFVC
jgi:hypothetical protein